MHIETNKTAPAKGRPAIRRCVRRTETLADGKVAFKTKSFTKDDGTTYEPIIDPETGEFSCTCPDHVYRRRACKHIARAVANLFRSPGVMLASDLIPAIPATEEEARAFYLALSDDQLEAIAPREESMQ